MELQPWEDFYYVPGLALERCPWCRRQSVRYCVVLWQGKAHAGQVMCEPCCERCAGVGVQYISMRKSGLKRLEVLRDFGIRE